MILQAARRVWAMQMVDLARTNCEETTTPSAGTTGLER